MLASNWYIASSSRGEHRHRVPGHHQIFVGRHDPHDDRAPVRGDDWRLRRVAGWVERQAARSRWIWVRESGWSVVMGGGGLKGGQVVGATDKQGVEVVDRPVTVPDLFCTFCRALGISPRTANQSNVGRPLPNVETGKAVAEVF